MGQKIRSNSDAGKAFRDRVKAFRRVRASELRPSPRNWRLHPEEQRAVFNGILKEIGFAGAVLARECEDGSLELIDGHLRQESVGDAEVPVLVTDLSEEEADKLLAVFDPISAMAQTDDRKLKTLLGSLEYEDESLKEMAAALAGEDGPDASALDDNELDSASGEVALPGGLGAFQLREGMVFESSLPYEYPPLRPDLLGDVEPGIVTWAGRDASPADAPAYLYNYGTDSVLGLDWTKTTLTFYTDDARWESWVWDKAHEFAAKLLNRKVRSVVVPNFSTYTTWPRAVRIYNLFRAFWCGRYMQEAGLRVIPDLQSPPGDIEAALAPIPVGAPCISVQVHASGAASGREAYCRRKSEEIGAACERLMPKKLLLYANTAEAIECVKAKLPEEVALVLVETREAARGRSIREKWAAAGGKAR